MISIILIAKSCFVCYNEKKQTGIDDMKVSD